MSASAAEPGPPATERREFALEGPLPTGTTVLEASAGTGKTYTIAALAARYVAEGVAELGQLMLVTFGRMATNELRSRVHDRLVDLEARMAEARAGLPHPRPLDGLETLLIRGAAPGIDTAELATRHLRITRALADFDAATIATTHEFCLQMLDGLGVLGDREPQAVFVEQVRDLTREVATDLYLHRYAPTGQPPVGLDEAVKLAERAVDAVHTRLVPAPESRDDQSDAAQRFAFATAVRAEVTRRKRSGRLFTYDDMLTRLRDALADPHHGAAAAQRLRDRYQVVLIDEFQDTDPIQWDIIRRAFHGATTLILIGDPKQAIYAFRGADVASYLDAVEQAEVLTLGTNWRSDHDLVEALDALMGGAALGDDKIVVRPVAAHQQQRRLRSASRPTLAAPVRLRYLPHEVDAVNVPGVLTLRPRIVADLVADVTAVLASDLTLDLGEVSGPRWVRPSDLAVLVRKNERGEAIRDALVAAGVPAVMHGASSVFASEMAQDWLTLLAALEQPRQQSARRASLTCFFGWTFARLADAAEDDLINLSLRVRGWSRVLAGRGVAALLEAATTDENVTERLLGQVGGARKLTDLRHLAQSLHAAMVSGQLGIGALVEWLRDRMAEAQGAGSSDGTRRLETDAKAVTILTVHRSKGLEFPIVYLPEAWDRHVNHKDEGWVLSLHEPRLGETAPAGDDAVGVRGECVLDVGGRSSEGRAARFAQDRAEDAGEDLRLCYVALTRAQCQVVAWWVPSYNTPSSALQRLLHRSVSSSSSPMPTYPLQGDPSDARPLGPGFALEVVERRVPSVWQPTAEPSPGLTARVFTRRLDLDWRRTSYSGLTAAVHGVDLTTASVGSEPEVVKEDDESGVPTTHPTSGGPALREVSPMAALPMGPDFGTAVHAIFEEVDAAAADLAGQLHRAAATVVGRTPAAAMTSDDLAAAMLPSFLTPLGPLAGDRRLADIARRDQLAELGFEFPLAGGDEPGPAINLGMVAPLLRQHLSADDPLRTYPDLIDHPALAEQSLRGYLNGSIDAVLRVRDEAGDPTYLVVDYKTNWLGSFDGEPLTLGHYTPERMAAAMMQAHYPLQALLYSVAVHRMLRWRQPGYDPDRHLGGVLYLFVRGMAGPETPRFDGVPCGVFSWRPPAALVTALSDLLDGVTP
ncbi:MAG TPA: UvrD-helicase domain-containing protein [Propionibacteriaceae bacterium]